MKRHAAGAPATGLLLFAGFEIKDATKGEVKAIVATLGVVDRDEDLIRAGAIANGAKVIVSSYGHDAMYGNRPAGKGVLSIEGDKVVFNGRMFLNTSDGRETFEVLKEMGADQEWSFGYRVLAWEVPSDDEKKLGARTILTKLDAFEVSPVMIGAGIGTQTVALKQADGDVAEPAAAELTPLAEVTPPAREPDAAAVAATAAATAAAVATAAEAAETARVAAAESAQAATAAEATRIADALEAKQLEGSASARREEFERFTHNMRRFGKAATS